jgi:hypothetical protein
VPVVLHREVLVPEHPRRLDVSAEAQAVAEFFPRNDHKIDYHAVLINGRLTAADPQGHGA